jgi:translocating chain-associated membrane protein 1
MSYMFKFYFMIQLSYWLHAFPELYFQKIKKEEMASRMTYSIIYLVMWTIAYSLHLNRIALCLAVIHYFVEGLFHASRLFHFADKGRVADLGFRLWNILFVLSRFLTLTLSVLTFWFGLAQTSQSDVSLEEGNFNTPIIRLNLLAAVTLLQAWMMWNFINFHLKRSREKAAEIQARRKQAKKLAEKKKKEDNELTGVTEQNGSAKKSKVKAN